MNTATHCHECGKELVGRNRYNVSPTGGGVCQNKAWCPDCYEPLHKAAIKNRVEHYAHAPSKSKHPFERSEDEDD